MFDNREDDEKTPNDGVGSSFINDKSEENHFIGETI